MKLTIIFILIFIIGEILSNLLVFHRMKKYFGVKPGTSGKFLFSSLSVWKGIIERFVIYFGLTLGFSSVLIVYGALKIGTRIGESKEDRNMTDYFLVGNFCSLLIVFIYFYSYMKIGGLLQ